MSSSVGQRVAVELIRARTSSASTRRTRIQARRQCRERSRIVTSMIDRQNFGTTGHSSSRVIFGAAGLGGVDQATADTLLPLLDEHGVNHLDTAASYGDAELRI